MTHITYAGIGARDTPTTICNQMRNAAKAMAGMGFILRSGGARGADSAFYQGYIEAGSPKGLCEIYLPKIRFNQHNVDGITFFGPPQRDARAIARKIHPNWPVLGDLGRDFMARNAYQILGYNLKTPCDFVLCWTSDGKASGGTGQAIRHAEKLGIPVFNLKTHSTDEISDFIFDIDQRRKT